MKPSFIRNTTTVVILLAATSSLAEDELKVRKEVAAAVIKTFTQDLGSVLKKQMSEKGPEEAIAVCRDVAPRIANELSLSLGWKVTRVGTRVRNAMLGMPDVWEQSGLKHFEESIAAGTAPGEMDYADIVTEGNQRYFRFMKPIVTQPLCMSCHGTNDTVSPTVKAVLEQQYPHDRAINYTVGELRGAMSIKQPLP